MAHNLPRNGRGRWFWDTGAETVSWPAPPACARPAGATGELALSWPRLRSFSLFFLETPILLVWRNVVIFKLSYIPFSSFSFSSQSRRIYIPSSPSLASALLSGLPAAPSADCNLLLLFSLCLFFLLPALVSLLSYPLESYWKPESDVLWNTLFYCHKQSSADFSSKSLEYYSHSFRLQNFILCHMLLNCFLCFLKRESDPGSDLKMRGPQVASVFSPLAVDLGTALAGLKPHRC